MGNGAYYAPDLTKAWLDPAWEAWIAITGAESKEEAMARFLMAPGPIRHLAAQDAQSRHFPG
jgi:nitric oxide reductase subunit C